MKKISNKTITTKLDTKLVRTTISNFPKKPAWEIFECSKLKATGKTNHKGSIKRQWGVLPSLQEESGGNYVFLLPTRYFLKPRKIQLSGPSVKGSPRKIDFCFTPDTVKIGGERWSVLYVGKASKMKQRFQWHFSGAKKNTGGQVQHNLKKCDVVKSRKDAVALLLDEGLICYSVLKGYDQAANREMIEVGLWAKYSPPFNIKSER